MSNIAVSCACNVSCKVFSTKFEKLTSKLSRISSCGLANDFFEMPKVLLSLLLLLYLVFFIYNFQVILSDIGWLCSYNLATVTLGGPPLLGLMFIYTYCFALYLYMVYTKFS